MQLVSLPHTDLKVSRLCFGTMTLGGNTGGQADERTSIQMMESCLNAGINFFDTANIYNNGTAEAIVGKALKGRRQRVVLASKTRGKMLSDDPAKSYEGLSRAMILRAVEDSLQRLETDYLDVYYMHWPDHDVRIEESMAAMHELVKSGKVRYAATSNYASWQVTQMLWLSEKNGWPAPWISQPIYNLLARGIEQEYFPMCKEFGVSTFIFNPLAGGMLTGKQQKAAPIQGTRFDRNQLYLKRYWHDPMFDAVEELKAIAEKAGRSMVSLALNWVLHHTPATGVIIGASKKEQLAENLKVAGDGKLDDETIAGCDAVWERIRGVTPRWCR
ncbi:MAG: aldo/keto reductase [Bryobacteraceae bacterium]